MLNQTVDNLTPLLSLLRQPAFCLRPDGSLVCNAWAKELAPAGGQALSAWLGSSAPLWDSWDRESVLHLSLACNGTEFEVSVEALTDGSLFLLTPRNGPEAADAALSAASQVLRQPLADLAALLQPLAEDPDLSSRTAAMTRQVYRLTRIAGNLADLERLRQSDCQPRLQLLDLNAFLTPLLQEVESLCGSAGRTLTFALPAKTVLLQADPQLVERALLNLVSNALKFSPPDTPIVFQVRTTQTHVLLQLQNRCSTGSAELLQSAFHRLEQRSQLPDPRWGVGLGLPLAQAIAKLHGGAVAVEATRSGLATVTLSLDRRRPLKAPLLEAPPPFEYTGGMRRTLVELSDSLPNRLFQHHAL